MQACHKVAMAIREEFKTLQKSHVNQCGRVQSQDADSMTPPTLDMLNRLLITMDIESLTDTSDNLSTRTKVIKLYSFLVMLFCDMNGNVTDRLSHYIVGCVTNPFSCTTVYTLVRVYSSTIQIS